MKTELPLLVCAALAVLAVQISQLPPPSPKQASRRRSPSTEEPVQLRAGGSRTRRSRLAWSGFACATIGTVGHYVLPAANMFWIALFVVAILSVPAAAVLSLGRGSGGNDDED